PDLGPVSGPVVPLRRCGGFKPNGIDIRMPAVAVWIAAGVMVTTAITDAAYVRFTTAGAGRRKLAAAHRGTLLCVVAAFAVISDAQNALDVVSAAAGSWIGAYVPMTLLRRAQNNRADDRSSPPP